MRALRDFNVPKIVTDDLPVFLGLIGDLFPALDVPRKRDQDFEKAVRQAATDLQLQPEDNFILKVSSSPADPRPRQSVAPPTRFNSFSVPCAPRWCSWWSCWRFGTLFLSSASLGRASPWFGRRSSRRTKT